MTVAWANKTIITHLPCLKVSCVCGYIEAGGVRSGAEPLKMGSTDDHNQALPVTTRIITRYQPFG